MKYHVILNASSTTFLRQIQEMNGFVAMFMQNIEKGETIIIATKESDLDEVSHQTVTGNLVGIIIEHYQPEVIVSVIEERMNQEDIYLFSGDYAGTELAIRCSAKRQGSSILNAFSVEIEGNKVTAEKMVYSNHLIGRFLLKQAPYCIAIAKGGNQQESRQNLILSKSIVYATKDERDYLDRERNFVPKEQKEGIDQSRVLIVAGRGVRKKEEVQFLQKQAEKIGAHLGISRPVAMQAWESMEKMVGVSGNICKPDVCITAGVSGAAAFYAGIEKSGLIVGINTDERAPIMKRADVVIVDDYKKIMEELIACILAKSKEEANE